MKKKIYEKREKGKHKKKNLNSLLCAWSSSLASSTTAS